MATASLSTGPVTDSGNASKRLQKELMTLMMSSGNDGISAFPDADNILNWTANIEGSKDTPFEGGLPKRNQAPANGRIT